jgi:hypothetical protein
MPGLYSTFLVHRLLPYLATETPCLALPAVHFRAGSRAGRNQRGTTAKTILAGTLKEVAACFIHRENLQRGNHLYHAAKMEDSLANDGTLISIVGLTIRCCTDTLVGPSFVEHGVTR